MGRSVLIKGQTRITTYNISFGLYKCRLESGPCFIRYSNENFFSVANTTSSYIYSSENYTDREPYSNALNALFYQLIAKINASENMVASGQESVNGIDKLYGLLQCTRDLNHQECYKCLSSLISDLQPPSLLAYTVGLRYFGFSCYVNYEMFPISITMQGNDPFSLQDFY